MGRLRSPISIDIHLTDRELQILHALCRGKTNKEIMHLLNLNYGRVRYCRANLFHKLGVRTVTQLIGVAWQRGLIQGIDSLYAENSGPGDDSG